MQQRGRQTTDSEELALQEHQSTYGMFGAEYPSDLRITLGSQEDIDDQADLAEDMMNWEEKW